MEAIKREFKGVWMPAIVYLNREVSWGAKIIWLEIDSLEKNDKECFFSNEYLAKFLNCSIAQVGRYIAELKAVGWVEDAGFDGRKRYLRSTLDYSKMSRQTTHEGEGRVLKNDRHNNSYNTFPNERNEESGDSSFQKPLFSTTEANPSNVEAETDKEPRAKAGQKPKKQKEKVPVDPAYPKFVQIWTEAYPELGFDGLSGRKIKSLITQTKGILRENGKDPDFEPWNLFAYILAYMKREGHWLNGKTISTVDSKYREVYFEIKHGKQKPNSKVSARDIINSL